MAKKQENKDKPSQNANKDVNKNNIMEKNNNIDKNKNVNTTKEISKEEQIGFHKGALSTLSKERAELTRILQIVEQLMQMHVAALNELGVDLNKEIQQKEEKIQSKKKPIEDVL